jgi:hypothetical protein
MEHASTIQLLSVMPLNSPPLPFGNYHAFGAILYTETVKGVGSHFGAAINPAGIFYLLL